MANTKAPRWRFWLLTSSVLFDDLPSAFQENSRKCLVVPVDSFLQPSFSNKATIQSCDIPTHIITQSFIQSMLMNLSSVVSFYSFGFVSLIITSELWYESSRFNLNEDYERRNWFPSIKPNKWKAGRERCVCLYVICEHFVHLLSADSYLWLQRSVVSFSFLFFLLFGAFLVRLTAAGE